MSYFALAPVVGVAVLMTMLAFMFWATMALLPLIEACRGCARRVMDGKVGVARTHDHKTR